MGGYFIVFTGRPWPVDASSHPSRFVGHFDSLHDACAAFRTVRFQPLPAQGGRRRWRGWGPQPDMIVQVEESSVAVVQWGRSA